MDAIPPLGASGSGAAEPATSVPAGTRLSPAFSRSISPKIAASACVGPILPTPICVAGSPSARPYGLRGPISIASSIGLANVSPILSIAMDYYLVDVIGIIAEC